MGIGTDVYVALAAEILFITILIGWAVTVNRREKGERKEEKG